MYVNPNDEQLRAFVGKVAGRVGQQAPWVPELGAYVLSSQSWGALAVKMHHYFLITRDDNAAAADMDAYTQACVTWALSNYQGLPRGLQKGVGVYPVLLQAQARPDVVAYTKQKPSAHWAAFALPTVVDLSTGRLDFMEQTPVWGFAMWKGVRKAAVEALG
ncbi:MAG: hypothetical protein IJI88_06535 [Atopobiaceae bacterium]|nr:hypothetical protein [Atopobiaceae bacterium]